MLVGERVGVESGQEGEEAARVLVVDREGAGRAGMLRVLAGVGHVLDVVEDARAARDRLADLPVEVVVISDGLGMAEALGLLDACRSQFPSVMRLFVTGPRAPEGRDALASGLAHRVVARPFQAETLEAVVRGLGETVAHVRGAVARGGGAESFSRMFTECVDGDLLRLAVQPIVRPGSGEVVAVECLLRSLHPRLDGPMSVIDAVERSSRVPELGSVVNRLAVAVLEKVPAPLVVFVNTHPAQFAGPEVVESFAPLLPWAPRVVLEITERAPLADFLGAEAALLALCSQGFRIAVDDIGSGYNSLSVLAELRPSYIKADMSIVRNVHLDARKQRLLQLLASFASATGAELIAEGVESAEEAAMSASCGAHLFQGFHLGRPQLDPGNFTRSG